MTAFTADHLARTVTDLITSALPPLRGFTTNQRDLLIADTRIVLAALLSDHLRDAYEHGFSDGQFAANDGE
jgi:hypothetical protein